MRKIFMVAILTAGFLSLPSISFSADWRAIQFNSSLENNGHQLNLRGTALKKVFFMKAFVAGFYLEKSASVTNVLGDVPKRIEVYYFVHIPANKLSDYTEKLIRDNMSRTEFDSLKDKMALMRQYFVDLNPGDRFALTYDPQVGTKFEYNGKLMGVIDGDTFAKGLFSTWLGERPMDIRVKKQILGVAALSAEEKIELALLSKDDQIP